MAFARSLPGSGFPELWFELPLAGEPWLDFHALASREHLQGVEAFSPETTGNCPEAFTWFARQGDEVRQLALSWDTGRGDVERPAVQLLVSTDNPRVTCDFLAAAGRADAQSAYRAFVGSIAKDWYPCYTGVFPGRAGHNLRVECIPQFDQQREYASDAALLERDLRQTGLPKLGDTTVERCQLLARAPFQLEFQFDVEPDGRAGATFGASVRFAAPIGTRDTYKSFEANGAAGELMQQVEAWGLADERWRLLQGTMFAQRVTHEGESAVLYCYPAFLKLRWRDGEPLDAKAYLIAGIQ